MGFFWMLLRSSSKIMATFIVLIFITFVMILFLPGVYVWLQNLAEGIDDYVRNPPMEPQQVAVYRFFVNGATILSVIMTLIARSLVEVAAWTGGRLFSGLRKEAELDKAEAKAGIRDGGYAE